MRSCIIIGSMPLEAQLLKKIAHAGDFLIAADGGYDTCIAQGIIPDLIVGDMDSSKAAQDARIEKITLPAEKDMTDLQAAIDAGLSRGFGYFILTGCAGGRFDHYFAAVCMLEYIFEQGADGEVTDENNTILFHGGGVKNFKRRPQYKYISVLPLDITLKGVTLKGLKYPLDNAALPRARTVGVSNEFAAAEATITIKNGRALVVYSR